MAIEKAGVIVALRWRVKGSGEENVQYQALRIRDGLIFDMQDCRGQRAHSEHFADGLNRTAAWTG